MESKNKTPMEKLTKGYEKFINGKELNKDGKQQFEKTLKKTVKARSVK
jgi:hypothetical protein